MKIIFMVPFLFIVFLARAQKGTATFSISYGDGKGQIKPMLAKAEMLGTYTEGPVRSYDVSLAGALSKSTALEIGISVLNHQYQFTKFDFPDKRISVNRSVNTLVFPIKLRVDILKYFFISGGFLLNTEVGQSDQVELGVGIGVGVQYYFKNKYGFFIYPQTNIHRVTIGLKENHIAFGLSYRILNN